MQIDRKKLCAIADVVSYVSHELDNLEDIMRYLNLDNDDRQAIEDAILVTRYKIDDIRKSKLTELGDHIDDSIENVVVGNRY